MVKRAAIEAKDWDAITEIASQAAKLTSGF